MSVLTKEKKKWNKIKHTYLMNEIILLRKQTAIKELKWQEKQNRTELGYK